MTEELRTTLHRIADSTAPLPVDEDLWQRGQAARRRGQAFAVAAVFALVVSVGGIATLVTTTDREARTASGEVAQGAIPSRIDTTDVPFETDLPIGRASVAFFASGGITLVGAEDGRYHRFAPDTRTLALPSNPVLALSPDGRRLAWATLDRIAIADLETGDVIPFAHNVGGGAEVGAMAWRADSTQLVWTGRENRQAVGGAIEVTGPSESPVPAGRYGVRGVLSPSSGMVALPSDGEVAAVAFLTSPGRGETAGEPVDRPLPTDLYPDGAVVTPLGWASEDLVVAAIDPPQGDVVERPRLAIFTSPDRPETEWVWREFLPQLPPVESLSIAVDLVPDLTGDPDQELTHDFTQQSDNPLAWTGIEVSLLIGLGVAAAIAVLLGLRWLWRRLLGVVQ